MIAMIGQKEDDKDSLQLRRPAENQIKWQVKNLGTNLKRNTVYIVE